MLSSSLRVLLGALPRWLRGPRGAGRACPVCGTGRPALFDATRERHLLICRACRHLYWDRNPSEAELVRFYESEYCETHGQPDIQDGHRAYYRSHVEELFRLAGGAKEDFCVVDYGCSIPVLVQEAKAWGAGRAVAVDVDRESLAYARRHGLEFMTPDEYAEHIPAGSVAAIRFSHVLEHLIDPRKAVEVAAEKLRPGGILYVTQPGFPVFRPRRTDLQLKDSVYPSHLHFFSPISLLKLLDGLPLEAEKLFSVVRHDEVFTETAGLLDLPYARKALSHVADKGEASRGEHANYPFYTGENSALYARKAA